MEQEYTERELRLIAEAVVDEFITSSLILEAGKKPPGLSADDDEIIITDRARNLIGVFLMGASSLLVGVPLVGWMLAPFLVLLAKLGILEDYVADYLQGKADIESVVIKIENIALAVITRLPNVGKKQIANKVSSRVKDPAAREAINIYVNNRTTNEVEKNNLLTAIYVTDIIMEMMQKNIKLPKTMGKKAKIKLPTNKLGQGLIVINPNTLPSPYNFLHGIQGPIEAEVIKKADPAAKAATDEFEHPQAGQSDVIIDADAEAINPRVPRFPSQPEPQLQLPGPVDDLDLLDYLVDDEDDDITEPIIREARYLQNLDDELKMIAMINEIKYARK